MTSFSSDVREEVLRQIPPRACCRKTILLAFLKLKGEGGSPVIFFSNAPVGRHLLQILKLLRMDRWGMGISRRGHGHSGKLILERDFFLNSASQPRKSCCRRNFARGAFLCSGHLVSPQKGYHLEITSRGKPEAHELAQILRGQGFACGAYARRKEWVVFVKGGDQVARFLNLLGAPHAFLRFEEVRAIKETKNQVRRLVNYESANTARMARAGSRQREFFLELMRQKQWRRLPATLREAAEWRIRYPILSLEELAGKLGVSKSALNHRLRRLEALRP